MIARSMIELSSSQISESLESFIYITLHKHKLNIANRVNVSIRVFETTPSPESIDHADAKDQGRKKEYPVKTKAASIGEHIREIA